MTKRLISCTASDLAAMDKPHLLEAIAASEGRVLACECIGITPPLLTDVTNAEYAAALSADLLLLNMFDVRQPVIQALPPVPPAETVRELKRLTGRPVGINLEPVDPALAARQDGSLWQMSSGRLATPENARIAAEMGVDMILLTGNPGNGVTNHAIARALCALREAVGSRVILAAGKMHAAGVRGEGGSRIQLEPALITYRIQGGKDWSLSLSLDAFVRLKTGEERRAGELEAQVQKELEELISQTWAPGADVFGFGQRFGFAFLQIRRARLRADHRIHFIYKSHRREFVFGGLSVRVGNGIDDFVDRNAFDFCIALLPEQAGAERGLT